MTERNDPSNEVRLPDPSQVQPEPEGSRWARGHHLLAICAAAALVLWLLSGFYMVGANETAVVERLGEYVSMSEAGSGLSYGYPWPIDLIHKVPIGSTKSIVVDEYSNISSPAVEEYKRELYSTAQIPMAALDAVFNPYLITADKNILNTTVTVNYRIDDAQQYLLGIFPPKSADGAEAGGEALAPVIQHAAAHALVNAMAGMNVDDALYNNPTDFNRRVLGLLRQEAKDLRLGIYVTDVSIKVTWPPILNDAFLGVANAKQTAGKMVSEAGSYAARRNAEADGEVSSLKSQAQDYARGVTDAAQGERSRFSAILEQYTRAPEVTRQSLFADGMSTILKNIASIYVVQPGQKLSLILQKPDERTGAQAPAGTAGATGGQ